MYGKGAGLALSWAKSTVSNLPRGHESQGGIAIRCQGSVTELLSNDRICKQREYHTITLLKGSRISTWALHHPLMWWAKGFWACLERKSRRAWRRSGMWYFSVRESRNTQAMSSCWLRLNADHEVEKVHSGRSTLVESSDRVCVVRVSAAVKRSTVLQDGPQTLLAVLSLAITGGRGGHTWQVHCEFVESF